MTIADEAWQRAVVLLSEAREVVLACHSEPDGDALGSMLALDRFLSARGVTTYPSWGSSDGSARVTSLSIPPQYTFLPGIANLVPPSEVPSEPEVFVAFDTASQARLGTLAPVAAAAGTVLVIDHHPSGSPFGDIQLCDGDAAATAVLVEELIARMGGELDRETAAALYVGLVTDTARFQNPTTTPRVMELAARLLRSGIDHSAISRQVWETKSFGYLKVLGRAMERARLVPEVGLAWTSVEQRDLADLGITMAETEGMIDTLRTVEAAEIALIAKERADGRWTVSLRSRGRVDVGLLATRFGGGGHTFAAGFEAVGPVEDIVRRVVAALEVPNRIQVAG